MKPRHPVSIRPSVPIASAIAALLAGQSAQGQTARYWDGNNGTANFGSASGTWAAPTLGTATAGWTTSGIGATLVNGTSITTDILDPLNFGRDTTGTGLGGGTITVSGTVDAASLRFGSQTTSNVTLSGGTINLAAATTIHVGAGGTTNHNIASSISGAGTSLTKTGNILTLSGANSYTGTTIISVGTLILNNLSALGSTSGINIGGAAAATLSSSLTGITISAPVTTANAGVTSTIAFGRGTADAGSIALNGAIGGNGNVAFTSPNANSGGNLQTINLGAAGTYAGSTNLNTGNINVNLTLRNSSSAANVLPTSTVLTFGTGAGPTTASRTTTFDLNGQNQTLAGLGSLAAVAVPNGRNHRVSSTAAATLTINSATDQTFGGTTVAGSLTTSAQITGAISLVKSGAGTFTLGGTLTGGATASGNTFTGDTKILGGILVLGETNSIRNSAFDTAGSIAGNATNGLRTTVTTLTLGGLTGGNNFATRFTTTGGYTGLTTLTLNPGTGVTHSYAGDVGDGATGMNLNKTGTGTQVLTGTHSYTGATTISNGTLQLDGSSDASSTVGIATAGTLSGNGTVNGNATLTGSGTINKSSGTIAGTLDVTGGNWTGAGTITGLVTSASGTFTIASGGNLTAISGVSATGGTLAVNGTLTGTLSASTSAIVTGTGTITGNTDIQGTHNPGNSPGIQTYDSNLSYSGGASVVNWELASNTVGNLPNPAALFDQIIVGGDLDFTNTTTLNLVFNAVGSSVLWGDIAFWGTAKSWTLYDVAGTTSNFANLSLTTIDWLDNGSNAFDTARPYGSFSLGLAGQDIVLNYIAVPEPRAALLGGLGLLALLRRRRIA